MKIKSLFGLVLFTIVIISCNKNNDAPFDAANQAVLDDESIVDYLKTHYYIPADEGEPFGKIDTILDAETPLFDNIKEDELTYNDINYKLYYYEVSEGKNQAPTRFDSIFIKYSGFTLDSLNFDANKSFTSSRGWLDLITTIQGWRYGFPDFNIKSGFNSTQPGEPITYSGTGKGVLFIPSGLAYDNSSSNTTLKNKPLLFHLELGQVIRSDYDNDEVSNADEDVDGSGILSDDDTDEDGYPNYVDVDDDGDLILTRNEDVNNNGDPMDDDTDGDHIANYLDNDDDGDGKLTKDEDVNGDGDPTNDDTNDNGIPNYLDPSE